MVARLCPTYVNDRKRSRGESTIGVRIGVYSEDGPRPTLVGRGQVRMYLLSNAHSVPCCSTKNIENDDIYINHKMN